MATTRASIKKQLGKSTTPGSIPVTNGSNELVYVAPGTEGQSLTVTAGVPGWSTPVGSATLEPNHITSPTSGTTIAFTATASILSSLAVMFFRNGMLQRPGGSHDYTIVISGVTATVTVLEAFTAEDTNLALIYYK